MSEQKNLYFAATIKYLSHVGDINLEAALDILEELGLARVTSIEAFLDDRSLEELIEVIE